MNFSNDLEQFIDRIINRYELTDIISVYSYGSIASGRSELTYSDLDLFVIIKNDTIYNRIKTIKKCNTIFKKETFNFLSKLYDNDLQITTDSCCDILYFTEIEFLYYCDLYPTRVIIPFQFGLWKLIYGINHINQMKLPEKELMLEFIQIDFELFAHEIHYFVFSDQIRELIKTFLRAIKKAIWIIYDDYIEDKWDVLSCNYDICNSKIIDETLNEIRSIVRNQYKILGLEYFNLYTNMCKTLEYLGKRVNQFLLVNNYKLIDEKKLYHSDLWHNFIWDFSDALINYISIDDTIENIVNCMKTDFNRFLTTVSYFFMENISPLSTHLGKEDCPPIRSKICNSIEINDSDFCSLTDNAGFLFLLSDYMTKERLDAFRKMTLDELHNYCENKFYPAIYSVYSSTFLINSELTP